MRLLPIIVSAFALTLSSPANAATQAQGLFAYPDVPTVAGSPPLVLVPDSEVSPAGRRLSADTALAIAEAVPEMRALRDKHPGSRVGAYLAPRAQWVVGFFSPSSGNEIGLVVIGDRSGQVIEHWTGVQLTWVMARGVRGAFGGHVEALYVWLPLCLLFMLAFFDFRRPFSLLHLDLLALLSFSVSLALFNHAKIHASVPLAYPPLLYLLARMLSLLRRRDGRADRRPLHVLVPIPWLALAVLLLLAFRIALNVTDSKVIDVGYSGVAGAQHVVDGEPLYGSYDLPENEHPDTYGPVNYEAYVPFEQIFGWNGTWNELPAAHAAAILFDLLALTMLFLLGRRVRGPALGVALAYAWVSYPFTFMVLDSNADDCLLVALVLAAVLAASYSSSVATGARGGLVALAGLTKFAPLGLAPLLATHGLRETGRLASRTHAVALCATAFLVTAVVVSIPALSHDSLHTIYERTVVYQTNRGSPFSIWGLYGLHGPELVVEAGAVAVALLLAVIPRRADAVGLAAACAVVMIAVQLGVEYWFYLYIPWFFPLVMLALLGSYGEPARSNQHRPPAPA